MPGSDPACDFSRQPKAKAVLAVDYFGFPQDLAPFERYCSSSGAVLIEDNAHGLFSCDGERRPLGARGHIGIFSLRKTLPAANGAALAANDPHLVGALEPQVAFESAKPPLSFRVKHRVRQLVPLTGIASARCITAAARAARWLRSGHRIPPSAPDAERHIPSSAAPSSTLLDIMDHTDIAAECARRRLLYEFAGRILDPARFPPLFDALPENVVPYGYPFRADAATAAIAADLLNAHGLECFCWPELPDAVGPTAPAHYTSVWMVGFLW